MTGRSRITVRRYIEAATKLGLEPGGPGPTDEQLGKLAALNLPGPRRSSTLAADALEEHAARIERWLNRDRLQLTRIHELLGQRGCDISYTSLRSSTTTRPRSPGPIRRIRCSRARSPSTASTGGSSGTPVARGRPRTNPRSNAESSTRASDSSRGRSLRDLRTCGSGPATGARRWPADDRVPPSGVTFTAC